MAAITMAEVQCNPSIVVKKPRWVEQHSVVLYVHGVILATSQIY